MADRQVESDLAEIPQIPDLVETVLLAALAEAKLKLEDDGDVVPFTALAVKDKLFIETHPGESADECFAAARHTVQNARGAGAYALCYDGYVETDAGTLDALIAEGGLPGEPEGFAVGYLYEYPDGEDAAPKVSSEPVYIGPAPNFMVLAVAADPEDEDALAEELEAALDGADADDAAADDAGAADPADA